METWKDIKGYEGLYQVSNEGRVKSLGKEIITRNKFGTCTKKLKEKILAQTSNKYGYQKVGLTEDGVEKKFLIHRLVAEAFIENPDNKPFIDHINTIKTDNSISNLRWCTRPENNNNPLTRQHLSEAHKGKQHSEDTRKKISDALKGVKKTEEQKRKQSLVMKGRPNYKLRKQVYQYTLNDELVKVWNSASEAAKYGYNISKISECCYGHRKHHKGFKWSYTKKEDIN